MIAIQITQIENGFVVALPPSQTDIISAAQAQQQPQPKVVFCADYSAVCTCLKGSWPVNIVE